MSEQRDGGEDEGREDGGSREKASPLEWMVAGLGTLLVLGAAAFLLHDALSSASSPPRIRIEVDTVFSAGQGYVVEFRARNDGQTTAAGLLVEGEIRSDTGTVETSQVTIDFVPAGGMRRAGLLFTEDPRQHRLEIRPKGYDLP